jgi:release factor glutamine methyltransferase
MFEGFKLTIRKHVYEPSDDTHLMAEYLRNIGHVSRAIEFGGGSGALALIASLVADQVEVHETSVPAYLNIIENVSNNGLCDRVNVFLGIREGWDSADLIYTNPPYLPQGPLFFQSLDDLAWNGGPDGVRVLSMIIHEAVTRLNPWGRLAFVTSSLQDRGALKYILIQNRLVCKKVLRKRFFFEELGVWECVKN